MKKMFFALFCSGIILFCINIIWIGINLYLSITLGVQSLLQEMNFVENVYFSLFLKWILLADAFWIVFGLIFVIKRKEYKTDLKYYLQNNPIENPKISVIIPTFNEEENVEKIVKDYKSQKNVEHVFVIDNHSTDKTTEIAEQCGARVFKKKKNMGFADSCIVGFDRALETDSNIIVLTECDGTYNAYDIEKMVPYLNNCDMVVGTRLIQSLIEKGNQNGIFNTWGNFFIAKLIQMKYFSLAHMGTVSFTDIGCAHRCIRRESLEVMLKDIKKDYGGGIDKDGWLFLTYIHMRGIESGLKIVEIPITFKKRLGKSKSGANKKVRGIKLGLRFIIFVLTF